MSTPLKPRSVHHHHHQQQQQQQRWHENMRLCDRLSNTNDTVRNQRLVSHVVLRCRPLTTEEWRVCIVESSPSSSALPYGKVALTYPVAVHKVVSPSSVDGEKKGVDVSVTSFETNGKPHMHVFSGVFDTVFLPQVVQCLARLRHKWKAPTSGPTVSSPLAGVDDNNNDRHCYNTLLDPSTVSGPDAIVVMQTLQGVVMQSTTSSTKWTQSKCEAMPLFGLGKGGDVVNGEEEEDREDEVLQRYVEQLNILDPLCSPKHVRGGEIKQGLRWQRSGRVEEVTAADILHRPMEDSSDAPIVPLLLNGHHVAVVAYGPPQSGKTHTLFGTPHSTPGTYCASESGVGISSLAHMYTPGLITHVVRHLENRIGRHRRRQKRQSEKNVSGSLEMSVDLGNCNPDDVLARVALVAFHEELPEVSHAGVVPWVSVYDLWNPMSFAEGRRTVRLSRPSPPPPTAAATATTGNRGRGPDGEGSNSNNKNATLGNKGCQQTPPLTVEDAVWFVVQTEDEMTLQMQRGMQHLALLRKGLVASSVDTPLHVALLLRTAVPNKMALRALHGLSPSKATTVLPPFAFYAEGIFIELQWTPHVANGNAFCDGLCLAPTGVATAGSSVPRVSSTLSLLLQTVHDGNAKLFLIATVHASLLHAPYTMDALRVAALCKQLCPQPQQSSFAGVPDPSVVWCSDVNEMDEGSGARNIRDHISNTLHVETTHVARLSNKEHREGEVSSEEMMRNGFNTDQSCTLGALQPSLELHDEREMDRGWKKEGLVRPTLGDYERFIYPNDLGGVQRLLESIGWGRSHLLRPATSAQLVVSALIDAPLYGSRYDKNSEDDDSNNKNGSSKTNNNRISIGAHDRVRGNENTGFDSARLSPLPSSSSYAILCMQDLSLDCDLRRFFAHPEERCTRVPAERLALCHKRIVLLELLNFLAEVQRSRIWKPDGPTVLSHVQDYKNLMRGNGPTFCEAIDQRMLKMGEEMEEKERGEVVMGVQFQTVHTLSGFSHLQRLKRAKVDVLSGEKTTAFVATTVAIRGHFVFYFDGVDRPRLGDKAKGGCYLLGATIVAITRRMLENRQIPPLGSASVRFEGEEGGKRESDTCDDGNMKYFVNIIPSVRRSYNMNHLFDTQENHLLLGFRSKNLWKRWRSWLIFASLPFPSSRLQRHFGLKCIEEAAISSFNELHLSRLRRKEKKAGCPIHPVVPWNDKCFQDTGRPLPLTRCELCCVITVLEKMVLHHTYAQVVAAAMGAVERKRNRGVCLPSTPKAKGYRQSARPIASFEEVAGLPLRYLRRWYKRESADFNAGLRRAVDLLFDVDTRVSASLTGASSCNNRRKKANEKMHLSPPATGGGASSTASHNRYQPLLHAADAGALAMPSVVLPLAAVPFATQLRTSFVTRVCWRGAAGIVKEMDGASSLRRQKRATSSTWDEELADFDDAKDNPRHQADVPTSYRMPFRHSNLLDIDRINEHRYASHVWMIDHFEGTIACTTSAPREEDPHLRHSDYIRSVVYKSHELLHVGRCDSFTGDKDREGEGESRVTHAFTQSSLACLYGVVLLFYRGHHIIYNEYFDELQERERFMECVSVLRPTIRTFAPIFTTTLLMHDESFDNDVMLKSAISGGINLRTVMATAPLACVSRFWSAILQHMRQDGVMREDPVAQRQGRHRHRREKSFNLKVDATRLNSSEYKAKKVRGLTPFAMGGDALREKEHYRWKSCSQERIARNDIVSFDPFLADAQRQLPEEKEEEEETISVKLEGVCGLQISEEATMPLTLWTGTVNLDGLPMENPESLRKWLDLLAPHWRMACVSVEREDTLWCENDEMNDDDDDDEEEEEESVTEFSSGPAAPAATTKGNQARLPYDMIALTAQEVSFHRTPARFIAFVESWFQQQGYVPITTAALNTAVVLFLFARRCVACLCAAVRLKKIPLSFTALHGERGAVVVTVDVGQSPICFVALYLHTLASHTTLEPLALATHCALIQEVLAQIPGGTRGCFLQPAPLHKGNLMANNTTWQPPSPHTPELVSIRNQTNTVDGMEYYDFVFLMGYWGMPLLLSPTRIEKQQQQQQKGGDDGASQAIVELAERLRMAFAEIRKGEEKEDDAKNKDDDVVDDDCESAQVIGEASGARKECGGLPRIVSELLQGHDMLTVLRDASLLLSRSCGVLEAMPQFLPTSSVVPGTTRYDLQFFPSAAEVREDVGSGAVDGFFLAYPSRILYKHRISCDMCDWQATPRVYGSVMPILPPCDSYSDLAARYHRKMQKKMWKHHAAMGELKEVLLSKHLPVSATFTVRVLRPCLGGTFWGREEALQPGFAQSWLLRLLRLAVQLPVQVGAAANEKSATLTGKRYLAFSVQLVPLLSRPVLILARKERELTGATAVLLHRQTRRVVGGLAPHTSPELSMECLLDDYSIDPIPSLLPSTPTRSPPPTATACMPSPSVPALADIMLLPHHAVVLAHAKMLFSVFDFSDDETTARLVGSATLPLVDIMHATVQHATTVGGTSRWENGAKWKTNNSCPAAAQDVELPPLDIPLHRCGCCVGTMAVVCSPLTCAAATPDNDLL